MSAPGGGEGQQRIAVTGASGFIGSRLVPWLEAAGRDVVPVSRQAVQSGRSRVVDRYTDVGALARAFDGCDGVVHLAARAHVLREPDADAQSRFDEANVAGARAVAQACRDAGVGRLVLVSSIGVNGSATCGRPFTASDPPAPDVPYARSKAGGTATTRDSGLPAPRASNLASSATLRSSPSHSTKVRREASGCCKAVSIAAHRLSTWMRLRAPRSEPSGIHGARRTRPMSVRKLPGQPAPYTSGGRSTT